MRPMMENPPELPDETTPPRGNTAGLVLAIVGVVLGLVVLVGIVGVIFGAGARLMGRGSAMAGGVGTPAQRDSAATIAQSLNSQVALYRLQHNDKYPDFGTYPEFEQLTQFTSNGGRTSEIKTPNEYYGPYFQRKPVNPINGKSNIVVVTTQPKPGDAVPNGQSCGWVFCTFDGKFSVTDAAGTRVIDPHARPQVTAASPPQDMHAAISSLQSTVMTMRSQIALYKLQHLDQLPDFKRYPNWEQLTQTTDMKGQFAPRGYGPYVQQPPRNALNGHTRVEVVPSEPLGKFKCTTPGVGFIVEADTGRVWGLDDQGRVVKAGI
jgi:hypothetical protein